MYYSKVMYATKDMVIVYFYNNFFIGMDEEMKQNL